MSQENKPVDQNLNQENPAAGRVDPFEEMESERHVDPLQDDKAEEPVKVKPSKPNVAPENKDVKNDAAVTKQEEESDDAEESGDVPELELLKKEVEKNKKSLLDAQKWGTKNSQKVKYALKKLNALIENGSFTEDEENEAVNLRKMLETDIDAPFDDEKASNTNKHPISKYIDIASEKLGVMKELSDDPETFYKKYRAFEVSLVDYKSDEMELLADELSELKDNPIKLAKKIMDMGEQYYNEYYKEFEETGGYRNLIQKRNKENENLKKEIDKLKKKLLTYEDFDNPKYRIGEDSTVDSGDESAEESKDPFESMEQSRDSRLKNRR